MTVGLLRKCPESRKRVAHPSLSPALQRAEVQVIMHNGLIETSSTAPLSPFIKLSFIEQMGGFRRILIGLGNDELGYLILSYDFREGVYEQSMSPGPAAALVVRNAAIRMLKGIR